MRCKILIQPALSFFHEKSAQVVEIQTYKSDNFYESSLQPIASPASDQQRVRSLRVHPEGDANRGRFLET